MTVTNGKGLGIDKVAPTNLGRVDAKLVGGHVEDPLDQLGGLWAAGAAVRSDGGGVGDNRRPLEAHLGDVVDAHHHHLGEHRQHRSDGGIRTTRSHDARVEADDLAVRGQSQLGVHREIPPMDECHHVL